MSDQAKWAIILFEWSLTAIILSFTTVQLADIYKRRR